MCIRDRAMGLVSEVFDEGVLASLPGQAAIGHVRYSTAGGSLVQNCQPLLMRYVKGRLAIAHNGNLTNAETVREEMCIRDSFRSLNPRLTVCSRSEAWRPVCAWRIPHATCSSTA